jgi:hypothetical protein
MDAKCGRTQPLLTGSYISGGSTEGLLGGWLAQRQAALRGMLAAGARFDFTLVIPCVPVLLRALAMPQERNFWN